MEQRASSRRKTFLGAQIRVAKFEGWSVDCAVKNVSEGGARIMIPHHASIPERFAIEVTAVGREQVKPARIIWVREGAAGIAFQDHADVMPASLVAARTASRVSVVEAPLEARIAAIVRRGGARHVPPSFERRRVAR